MHYLGSPVVTGTCLLMSLSWERSRLLLAASEIQTHCFRANCYTGILGLLFVGLAGFCSNVLKSGLLVSLPWVSW